MDKPREGVKRMRNFFCLFGVSIRNLVHFGAEFAGVGVLIFGN